MEYIVPLNYNIQKNICVFLDKSKIILAHILRRLRYPLMHYKLACIYTLLLYLFL